MGCKERLDVSEVSVGQLHVIPDLLRYQQCAQIQWSPGGGPDVSGGVADYPVGVNEGDDAALDGELSAVEDGLDEVIDVVFSGFAAQDFESLCVELIWIIHDLLFFVEDPQHMVR